MPEIGQPEEFDIFKKFREFIPWVSIDGFNYGGDPEYSVFAYHPYLAVSTGSAANSGAFLYSIDAWYLGMETEKKVIIEFIIAWLSSVEDQNIWLRLTPTVSTPPLETTDHFGWKIIGGDLYASNADGVTQKITDTGVDLVASEQRTRLKIILNPGVDCRFFVNDVLKVTHAASLPSRTDYSLSFHIQTLVDEPKEMFLGRFLLEEEC